MGHGLEEGDGAGAVHGIGVLDTGCGSLAGGTGIERGRSDRREDEVGGGCGTVLDNSAAALDGSLTLGVVSLLVGNGREASWSSDGGRARDGHDGARGSSLD